MKYIVVFIDSGSGVVFCGFVFYCRVLTLGDVFFFCWFIRRFLKMRFKLFINLYNCAILKEDYVETFRLNYIYFDGGIITDSI